MNKRDTYNSLLLGTVMSCYFIAQGVLINTDEAHAGEASTTNPFMAEQREAHRQLPSQETLPPGQAAVEWGETALQWAGETRGCILNLQSKAGSDACIDELRRSMGTTASGHPLHDRKAIQLIEFAEQVLPSDNPRVGKTVEALKNHLSPWLK